MALCVKNSCTGGGGDAGDLHVFTVSLNYVAGQWYSGGTWTIPEDGIYKINYFTFGHNCVISNQRFFRNGSNLGTPATVTCSKGDTVEYQAYAYFERANERGACAVCSMAGPFSE